MSQTAILVENLSKKYLIGHRFSQDKHQHIMLRDVLGQEARNFLRKAGDFFRGRQMVQGDQIEEFWALEKVSFEVKLGEIVGIIGRNGAGKSTLLKILSRITEPTAGRAVLAGRVASLLEVGTGFHPELTGRENIFLNGAILGMTQRDIRSKLDEIVAFAEVEKFLDTPVKHYSSGMYVRLAFAIAAHLEPEVLIVDEVLAVGDAEFQKKCLGKMNEVSRKQGRTVLFVSHNMEAVLRLCTRGILLELGGVHAIGDAKAVVSAYLQGQSPSPKVVDLLSKAGPSDLTGKARLVRASPSDAKGSWFFPFGQPLSLDFSIEVQSSVNRIEVAVDIYSAQGFELASWTNKCSDVELPVRPGINVFRIRFEQPRFLPGRYMLGFGLGYGQGFEDWFPDAVTFEITSSSEAADINTELLDGAFVPSATVSVFADDRLS